MREEARRWLVQGDADLAHARASIQTGFYFAAAFACHQAVKQWLKGAVIDLRRALPSKTHNLVELGRVLEVPEEVMSDLILVSSGFEGLPWRDRLAAVLDLWDLEVDLQPLCYTPEEYARKVAELSTVAAAVRDGLVLTPR